MLHTEMPLASEIREAFQTIRSVTHEDWTSAKRMVHLMPFMEARYLITNRMLDGMGVRQVLELASGLSPRGIVKSENLACTYIEVDLPDEIRLKREIIANLVATEKIRPPGANFHLLEGNVLEPQIFTKAKAIFRKERIGVVCEGLLRYLCPDDTAKLSLQILSLLKAFGGAWITSDIDLLEDGRQQKRQDEGSGRFDIEENLFADMASARKFFEDLGFAVHITPFGDMSGELSSQKKCGLTAKQVAGILEGRRTFTMTLA